MHGSAPIEEHPGVLASLWKYRAMAAAIVAAFVIVSAAAAYLVQPRAQAKATIALASPPAKSVLAPGIQGDASLARYTAQRAAFVRSDAVLRAVAAELGRKDLTSLRRDISATPSGTSNTILVVAEADTDAEAVRLAAATVAAYRAKTAEDVKRRTDAALKSIDESALRVQASGGSELSADSVPSTLSRLAVEASEMRVSSALFGDGVEFVVAPRADAVTRPSFPLREAALGFVIGLVLAATAAWIRADRKGDAPTPTPVRQPVSSHPWLERGIAAPAPRPLPQRVR